MGLWQVFPSRCINSGVQNLQVLRTTLKDKENSYQSVKGSIIIWYLLLGKTQEIWIT